jgi:hypothetical protein
MIPQSVMCLFAAGAIGVALMGCNRNSTAATSIAETFNDTQWLNGELRIIVNRAHYVTPAMSLHGGGTMSGQEWILMEFPSLNEATPSVRKKEFLRMGGGYHHSFALIGRSDLLIHKLRPLESDGQCTLFDPKAAKDISGPFPAARLFNRSRTASLTLIDGKTVILDTLSARTGEPKVVARPAWERVLERFQYGRLKGVLTEDKQFLVLLPQIESPSYVTSSNFVVEVFSTNGNAERWSIPLDRNWEKFVDAESVDGKVLLLSRRLAGNGTEDEVKLISMRGETLHSGRISAFTLDDLWDTERQEVVFPYYEGSGWKSELPQTFFLWNYASNSVQKISVKR